MMAAVSSDFPFPANAGLQTWAFLAIVWQKRLPIDLDLLG
jgi:hypothetical protein